LASFSTHIPWHSAFRLPLSALVVLLFGTLTSIAFADEDPTKAPPNQAAYADWTILRVPGTWDENSNGDLSDYDGYGWYRCTVLLPGNWKDDLELLMSNIDNAHEVYFNGTKLGGAGK